MSAEVFNLAQFKSGTPVTEVTQAQLDFALRLTLVALQPPRIRNYCFADGEDIQAAIDAIGHVHALYSEFVTDVMKNLNENLPITGTVDTKDFLAGLTDLKNDLIGLLAITAQRVEENV
jgi:hypothetical protein